MSNKPWERDELILALDTYLALNGRTPTPSVSEIQDVSHILRQIAPIEGESRKENYRSINSVVMKLINFRSLDPTYVGVGLKAIGKADRDVWREFADDRDRLRQTAIAIRETLNQSNITSATIVSVLQEAPEGSVLTKTHLKIERSSKLVNLKKKSVLSAQGRLTCEACSFDFESMYGSRGNGFIECHHLKPVHTLRPGHKTQVNDLALVCSNCHRMIHTQHPWLTMDELKNLIQQRKAESGPDSEILFNERKNVGDCR